MGRAIGLLLVLVILAAPAAAQPSAPAVGGALYLTAEAIGSPLPIEDHHYAWAPLPGPEGAVPLGPQYIYYNYQVDFQTTPKLGFTYLESALLKVPLRCTTAWTGVLDTVAYLYVGETSASVSQLTVDIPLTCLAGQIVDVETPWDLSYLRLRAGEMVRLEFSSPLAHPGNGASVEIVTGDIDHPAGLFAPWTSGTVFQPFLAKGAYDANTIDTERRFWATDADAAKFTINATLKGGNRYLEVSIHDLDTGDQVNQQRFETGSESDDAREVSYEAILPAGDGTAWRVEIDVYGNKGTAYQVHLVPVVLTAAEEKVEAPTLGTETATAGPTTSIGYLPPITGGNATQQEEAGAGTPAQEAKATPLGMWLPLAAVALAGLLTLRRRLA